MLIVSIAEAIPSNSNQISHNLEARKRKCKFSIKNPCIDVLDVFKISIEIPKPQLLLSTEIIRQSLTHFG